MKEFFIGYSTMVLYGRMFSLLESLALVEALVLYPLTRIMSLGQLLAIAWLDGRVQDLFCVSVE